MNVLRLEELFTLDTTPNEIRIFSTWLHAMHALSIIIRNFLLYQEVITQKSNFWSWELFSVCFWSHMTMRAIEQCKITMIRRELCSMLRLLILNKCKWWSWQYFFVTTANVHDNITVDLNLGRVFRNLCRKRPPRSDSKSTSFHACFRGSFRLRQFRKKMNQR